MRAEEGPGRRLQQRSARGREEVAAQLHPSSHVPSSETRRLWRSTPSKASAPASIQSFTRSRHLHLHCRSHPPEGVIAHRTTPPLAGSCSLILAGSQGALAQGPCE